MAPSRKGAEPNRTRRHFWDRPVLLAGSAMAAVFGIVLTVSLLIGRPDTPSTASAVATADARSALPAAGGVERPAIADSPPAEGSSAAAAPHARLHNYRDPRDGFEVIVDATWRAVALEGGRRDPLPAAAYSVTFAQSGTGARMSIRRWQVADAIGVDRWAVDVASGSVSVNGRMPTNAMIAGVPAVLVWSPESPVVPARYEAFFRRGGQIYGVAYAAYDGGRAATDFIRLLVTLEWAGAGGSVQPHVDLIPPLPSPEARFFPSARLFGGGGSG